MRLLKHSLFIIWIFALTACGEKIASKPVAASSAAYNSVNIYAATLPGNLAPQAKSALKLVYVPNSLSNTLSIINPATYTVINTLPVGKNPQHVVPAYDLKTLWVLNDKSNSATPIDPYTAKLGVPVPIEDPYNLYFTPDGRFAIGIAEAKKRFEFRDPHTFALIESVPVECKGLNHLDFTADGKFAVATCEFSGQLVKLDVSNRKILGYLKLGMDEPVSGCMPQDIRLSPNGRVFYIADMNRGGVFLVDPTTFIQIGFIPTGVGTHGIYPSRNGKYLYVANRGCRSLGCRLPTYCPPHGPGSVTVVDPATQKVVAYWVIPAGGSPDMGNVTEDGKELWLSGRYDHEVYVFDTMTGQVTHRIPVGKSPHGLTVWPQPGRYSLGHTGNMR